MATTADGTPYVTSSDSIVTYPSTSLDLANRVDSVSASPTLALGSASAPSLRFKGDSNTGLWSPAADTVAASTGGTERMRITSAGNVGIGTSSPSAILHVSGGSSDIYPLIESQGVTAPILVTTKNSSEPVYTYVRKARGGATPAIVQSGDAVWNMIFQGYDGTTYQNAAQIRAEIDATPGSGDMPGRLVFSTTADGSTTLTERMRINNAGLITGTGTSLGAWTAYTPSLTNATLGNGTITGAYCQIGKIVHFRATFVLGSTSTIHGTGNYMSLPVQAAANEVTVRRTFMTQYLDASVNSYTGTALMDTASTVIFYVNGTNGQLSSVTTTAPFTWGTSDRITVSGTYEAA